MAITLTPQVPIPSGGRLIITLVGGFAGSSLTCSSSPTGCNSAAIASNVLTLGFNALMPSVSLVITVTGVSNPTAIQFQLTTLASASYKTSTLTDVNQIGASSAGVLPEIIVGPLGTDQPTVSHNPKTPLSTVVTTIVFTPVVAVPIDGTVIITLPTPPGKNFGCNSCSSASAKTISVISDTESSQIRITLKIVLSAGVQATITISGIKTPGDQVCTTNLEAATYISTTISPANQIGVSSMGIADQIFDPFNPCPQ
jgi:hypothetical protein